MHWQINIRCHMLLDSRDFNKRMNTFVQYGTIFVFVFVLEKICKPTKKKKRSKFYIFLAA